jgi:hypothetical protein
MSIIGAMARSFVGAGIACAVALAVGPASASAQNKELSDKSVAVLMHYAWTMTPTKFTTPTGKVIEVDKSKKNDVVVPIDVARDVIKVARLTAFAQLCDLPEEQAANYQTFMRREEAKAKWTDQQLLYISQLHLFTVMTMTGKIQVVQEEGDKQVIVQDGKSLKTETCTDTEKQKIQAQITAFINAPPPAQAATAAPPVKRVEPVSATPKK